jgi:hypothetical protein
VKSIANTPPLRAPTRRSSSRNRKLLPAPFTPAILLRLVVDAGGTPGLNYQWRKATVPIGGATGSAYTVASASATDSGSYDVEISNSFGTNLSSAAVVVGDILR